MQGSTVADAETTETLRVVDRFNEAFNRHDVDAVMALMTDECIFESTSPAPDGARHQGQDAVRACWQDLFASSQNSVFEAEEIIGTGDRCIVRWVYRWTGHDGKDGHVRGVDIVRVQDGKLSEKFSYVKG